MSTVNYVIAFSDGSVKVGVTSRLSARVKELSRPLAPKVRPLRAWHAAPCQSAEAFRIEANLCRLLRYASIPGTREWFAPIGSSTLDWQRGFKRVVETTAMFWHLACPHRYREHIAGAKEFQL